MSQLDYVLQKQQQLTERSAIKPAHYPQFIRQHGEHTFNVPHNYHNAIDPPLDNRLYPPTVSNKVFFNPDFPRQPQNSFSSVNPVAKSNIHFNPNRLIQTNTNPQDWHQIPMSVDHLTYDQQRLPRNYPCKADVNTFTSNQQRIPGNIPNKVHVNPAVLNQPRIPVDESCCSLTIPQNNMPSNWHFNPALLNQQTIPNSVPIHINPKFVAKPLVSERSKILQRTNDISRIPLIENTIAKGEPSCSIANTTNFTTSSCHSESISPGVSVTKTPVTSSNTFSIEKLDPNSNVDKKSPNSRLVSISKRKLIRVKRNTRPSITPALNSSSPLKRRLSSTALKKTKISPKNKNRLIKVNNMKLVRTTDIHWYEKVDKIVPKSTYKKNAIINNIGNDKKLSLVDIDGVMFKKTGNKIVRSSLKNTIVYKKQRASTLNGSGQFVSSKGGKTLRKVDCGIRKVNTLTKINVSTITSISSVKSYKSSASNKVKQRSLQILRNKMRKNNQPCLVFRKYGSCNLQLTGMCAKVHDKKQIAVCKNFVQGKCLSNGCLLSHDIGPQKMPTCKFFLEGCCTREGCRYLHVKVSSKNPICVEFLHGYCPKGDGCPNRHDNACPEFDKSGACSKGESCPYPHTQHLTETKSPERISQPTSLTTAQTMKNLPSTSNGVKTGTRYYDNVSTDLNPACVHDTEDLGEKRVRVKNEDSTDCIVDSTTKDSVELEEEEHVIVCNRSKPMGPADSFIPIT